jgi:hypothetical protein
MKKVLITGVTGQNEILETNPKNKLFLFCCGPFGNILSHQLLLNNKENVYGTRKK